MQITKSKILFSNPHGNHSYFTVLALSHNYDIQILCPPLQLQLLFGRWTIPPRISHPNLFVSILSFFCTFAFLLFRVNILPESIYLLVFNYIVDLTLRIISPVHWYHYQDYTFLSPRTRLKLLSDTCELIIDCHPSSSNRASTLKAIDLADRVVLPSRNMKLSSFSSSKSIFLPYGGNKQDYLDPRLSNNALTYSRDPDTISIAARANSIRKGAVPFLNSLFDVLIYLDQHEYPLSLEIIICGTLSEPEPLQIFQRLKSLSINHPKFSIISKRFSQSDYLTLLSSSDLFLLPTSLEGCSPAALEALWIGLPCILTEHAGVDSFTNNRHGLLLENNSKDLISRSLISVLSSPNILQSYKSNIISDKDSFTWSCYLSGVSKILSPT